LIAKLFGAKSYWINNGGFFRYLVNPFDAFIHLTPVDHNALANPYRAEFKNGMFQF